MKPSFRRAKEAAHSPSTFVWSSDREKCGTDVQGSNLTLALRCRAAQRTFLAQQDMSSYPSRPFTPFASGGELRRPLLQGLGWTSTQRKLWWLHSLCSVAGAAARGTSLEPAMHDGFRLEPLDPRCQVPPLPFGKPGEGATSVANDQEEICLSDPFAR